MVPVDWIGIVPYPTQHTRSGDHFGNLCSAWENDKIPIGVHEAIIFVIMASLTFAYSIGLLIWKHRLDARRNEKGQVEKISKDILPSFRDAKCLDGGGIFQRLREMESTYA